MCRVNSATGRCPEQASGPILCGLWRARCFGAREKPMAGTTGTLTATVVSMLSSGENGVNVRVGAIEQADASLHAAGIRSIVALNASVEISEKTGHALYPALLVYCDKFSNSLREKFRQFS